MIIIAFANFQIIMPRQTVNKTLPTLVIWLAIDLYSLVMFLSIQPGAFLIGLFTLFETAVVLSVFYKKTRYQLAQMNSVLWMAMLANFLPRIFAILLIRTNHPGASTFDWLFPFCKFIAAAPISGLIVLLSRNNSVSS